MTGPAPAPASWDISFLQLPAQEAHDIDVLTEPRRRVLVIAPPVPALVLGSTQRLADVDAARLAQHGRQLARRRSGGGAVLVDDGVVWIDFVIPRADPLWCDDVGESMVWVGESWQRALASLGIPGDVHRGPARTSPLSKQICFCGLGSGEVVVGGRKVVGVSQRRARAGARLQSVGILRCDDSFVDALAVPSPAAARRELQSQWGELARTRGDVVAAVLRALP